VHSRIIKRLFNYTNQTRKIYLLHYFIFSYTLRCYKVREKSVLYLKLYVVTQLLIINVNS